MTTSLTSVLTQRPVVLDGGFATRLEARGHDLSGQLWSAALLVQQPEEIVAAHADFFAAGAEVAITASYQVSFEGMARIGVDRAGTEAVLRRSVDLARRAADEAGGDRWVAASVGPYGAALADGSEYRGDYDLTVDELRRWHRPRLAVLAEAGADVLAVETIPCAAEVEAVLAELDGLGVPAWISVSADGSRTRRGEDLASVFAQAATVDEVIAVGVNCCAADSTAAVAAVAVAAAGKPAVAYPNSGEVWNADTRTWSGDPLFDPALVDTWTAAGARLVGGCCRVTPAAIAGIAARVLRG